MRIHLRSGRRKAVRRPLRMARGESIERIAEEVSEAKAEGSGVERFTGARIECRLQRSERSIFPAQSR